MTWHSLPSYNILHRFPSSKPSSFLYKLATTKIFPANFFSSILWCFAYFLKLPLSSFHSADMCDVLEKIPLRREILSKKKLLRFKITKSLPTPSPLTSHNFKVCLGFSRVLCKLKRVILKRDFCGWASRKEEFVSSSQ